MHAPEGEISVDAPPVLDDPDDSGGFAAQALPMLAGLGSVVLLVGPGSGATGHRTLLLVAVLVTSTVGLTLTQVVLRRGARRRREARRRAAYFRHLAEVRTAARDAARAQRDASLWRHPPPDVLPAMAAEGSRVWEREESDPDFLHVRYGVGPAPLSVGLAAPERGSQGRVDPAAAGALARLLAVHGTQPDLPAALDLHAQPRIAVHGSPGEAHAIARAVICAATAFHAPEHLGLALLTTKERLASWDWLKWLPHLSPTGVVCSADDVPTPTRGQRLLLVVDGTDTELPELVDTTVLDLSPRPEQIDDQLSIPDEDVVADQCGPVVAEAFARRLAPRHTSRSAPDYRQLLRTTGVRRPADRLRVPIGVGGDGSPVLLDLKESAEGGTGPHGLLVGATGSGKSELLRTLVIGLALTHPPETLTFVLVDYKGGATFAALSGLPHVSGLVTNLADDGALVDRLADALAGELVRRQQVLRDAGHLASARDLAAARTTDPTLPPLPALVLVVDEFTELLSAAPDLIDLFGTIGRLGRSLGIHLLLASQRLDEGRLRGLESHLSYRLCLRTFSAQESALVLGAPDAFDLLEAPGHGLLRVGPCPLVRFTTSYVSGRAPTQATKSITRWTIHDVRPPPTTRGAAGPTLLEEAVSELADTGPPAPLLWLPPLDKAGSLADVMPDLTHDPQLGLVSPCWRAEPRFVPLGHVDRPREQRRDVLVADLAGAGGHVGVVGGPRSGKSTLLLTIVAALAVTTTPSESQVYVVDLGGALAPLRALPHVAGVAGPREPDVVRRVVAEVSHLVETREAGLDDRHGEVFLVVDGWGSLRADLDELEPQLAQVAARGLAVGVHLVAAAARWADFRAGLRDLLGSRFELRLGDPLDSEVDRRKAGAVPTARPGRGLTHDGHHFLVAPPTRGLLDAIAAAWPGPPGPKLRLLPELIEADALLAQTGQTPGLVIGVEERALDPVALDPDTEPHWLVYGDRGSGKTAALRAYLHEVLRTRAPGRPRFVLVDYRRTLLGEVPAQHLAAHLTSADQVTPVLTELTGRLAERLQGGWAGPPVHVVVDDLDLVATTGSPLGPLVPLLPQARDIGLHLVVARRSSGAARASYEPVLQSLRDLATPTLLLSGSPDEGPLAGSVRPVKAPPGRGLLVTRDRDTQVVQLAWRPPVG